MDHPTTRAATSSGPSRAQLMATMTLATLMAVLVLIAAVTGPQRAYAAHQPSVGLGTATSYSVLAGQTVTNTGPSVLDRDLGVSPGDAVTGFPPGLVLGTVHAGDAAAAQAQADLTTAYNDAAGRQTDGAITADLGEGQTLVHGVYTASSSAQLTGALTLDGEGDPNSVFIFQIGSALTTATNSSINLINGAQACNVYFQVGSSATIGVGTDFVGTILALTSITLNTGATVDGRALARNGSVTLDSNVFDASPCDVSTPTPTPTADETSTTTPTPTPTPTADETSAAPTPTADETSAAPTPTADETSSSTPTASETETLPVTDDSNASDDAADDESGGSDLTGGSGSLADTGSSGLVSLLGSVGILLVVAAATLLAVARFRSGLRRRH